MIWGKSKWKSSPVKNQPIDPIGSGIKKRSLVLSDCPCNSTRAGLLPSTFAASLKCSCSIPGVQGKDHRYNKIDNIDTVVFCWKPMEILVRIYFINNFRVDYLAWMVFVWIPGWQCSMIQVGLVWRGKNPSKFTKPHRPLVIHRTKNCLDDATGSCSFSAGIP